jgi:hypothetical protein
MLTPTSAGLATAYETGRLVGQVVGLLLGVALVAAGVRAGRGGRTAAPPIAGGYPPQLPSPTPTVAPPMGDDPGDFFGTATTVTSATASTPPGWAPPPASVPQRPGAYPLSNAVTPRTQTPRAGSNIRALVLCTLGLLFVIGSLVQVAQNLFDNRHSVTLPATADTLSLLPTTPQMQQALDNAKASFPADAGVSNVQAGYYSEKGTIQPAAALVVGDTRGNLDPDSFFAGFRDSLASSGTAITLTPADTQGMGGRMECGTVTVALGKVGVCAWIDNGTMGVVITTPNETNTPAAVTTILRRSAES